VLLTATPLLTDAGICPTEAAADAADFAKFRSGTLTGHEARDSTSAGSALVPFLPKLPGS
jgi:hypothetical protein